MKKALWYITLVFFCAGCDLILPDPAADGDIRISQVKTRHDYSFPLKLINDNRESAVLNNEINIPAGQTMNLPHAGFYEMKINKPGGSEPILFNLIDPERGETEWGLKKWTPGKSKIIPVTNEVFEIIHAKNTCPGIYTPVVIFAFQNNKRALLNNHIFLNSGESFALKNGFGSINLPSEECLNLTLSVENKSFIINTKNLDGVHYRLSGKIDKHQVIAANSVAEIAADLEISAMGSLRVEEGAILKIAPGISIRNYGPIKFSGTKNNPVVVTCSEKNDFWGGFIAHNENAILEANHTFFSFSGKNTGKEFELGHAKRQALFQSTRSELTLKNCYILDNAGQVFYTDMCEVFVENVLIQRAKTGGQVNWGNVTIANSIFSDFPDDTKKYLDEDNDGLYINGSNVNIVNAIFMHAKDDGIDSGGTDGGEIKVVNSIFEACFHEGAALSSNEPSVKNHTFTKCIFRNNGQGLELGYSSSNHRVMADSCLFENNLVGIRYGDNYPWNCHGTMEIKNSVCKNNELDIWNMQRSNWTPNLQNLTFYNTSVSKKNKQYPQLPVNN